MTLSSSMYAVTGSGAMEERRAIVEASRRGDVHEVARLLLKGPRLLGDIESEPHPLVTTPLMQAARHNQLDVARLLLDRGACIDTLDIYTWSSLMHACHEGHERMASLLLERGADPSIRSYFDWNDGHTSMMIAARRGHTAVVKTLLREGRQGRSGRQALPVDDVNDDGQTALFMACLHGHTETARLLLLEGGADPRVADVHGNTAKQVAAEEGHEDCARLLQWFEDETQRAFTLHKARAVRVTTLTAELYPTAPPPSHLKRCRSASLPELRLEPQPENLTSSAERSGEEERTAMLDFVTGDMLPELYEELLRGMQVGRMLEVDRHEEWGRRKRKAEHMLATMMIKRQKLQHQPPSEQHDSGVDATIRLALAAALSRQARKAAQVVEPQD